jgi:hypothetical protein
VRSSRRFREVRPQLHLNGDLIARKEAEGISERYLVCVDSLYALRGRRSEQRQAEENAERLREELEAERGKGFWRRLFGPY